MNEKLISSIEPFYVMEILEKANKLEEKGRKIVHLEIGEPTESVHPFIKKEAISGINRNNDKYSHSLGLPALRNSISKKYFKDFNLKISPDRMAITTGASSALVLSLLATMSKGDEVVLVEPYYPCYPQLIKIFGGKVKIFTTRLDENFQINTSKFKSFISSKTKLIILNSPSNPTGVSQSAKVLKFLSSLKIQIISDEIYQGLNYGAETRTILNYAPSAIVVNGFSKLYSMTGWRLGHLIVPMKLIRGVQKLQQNMFICAPVISQYGAIGALRISKNEIDFMLSEYKARRDFMLSALNDLGIDVAYNPDSSFYVFCNMEKYCKDSLKLSLDILNRVGLAVAPGRDFGPTFNGYIRLSYSSSFKNIKNGLKRLKKYIKEYT